MRLIFAGTPEFARVALAHLHAAGFELALVLTQPDRPAGRGLRLQASPVKQWSLEHAIPVAQPRSLRLDGKYPDEAAAGHAAIRNAEADVMVVAAYGLLLPLSVLDMMAAPDKLGCINIHASLLPRWRGAAPIHRAIEAGDAETGITTMQMDAGLDTGAMLLAEKIAITETDTTGTLHDRLAELGGRLIVDTLKMAASGKLNPRAQPAEGVSYARKVEKHEALVDWTEPAPRIARRIRAFNPAPVCATMLGAEPIKLLAAHVVEHPQRLDAAASDQLAGQVAGQVIAADANGVDVVTGDGLLRITQLQKAGGKPMAVADFLRGFPLHPGAIFARTA